MICAWVKKANNTLNAIVHTEINWKISKIRGRRKKMDNDRLDWERGVKIIRN